MKDEDIIELENNASIRLNKFISSSGFCSRREADRFIIDKKVQVDGNIAEIGTKVYPYQEVIINGITIQKQSRPVYIALNKPKGIICTTDTSIKDNIITFLQYPTRIFPIGRLDRDSSGLILLTNDGDIVNKILRSTYHHEKEYIVEVNKAIDTTFIQQLQNGVTIYNPVNNTYQTTKPCQAEKLSKTTFRIILTQGLNRQIRRMCTSAGYRVTKLKRIRIMNIQLHDLTVGTWRHLNETELFELQQSLKKNSKEKDK